MAMSACSTVDVDTNKPVLEVLTLHLLKVLELGSLLIRLSLH